MTRHQALHHGVQWMRHGLRLAVIVLMVGIAYLSLYGHYRSARAMDDLTDMTGVQGTALRAVDSLLGDVENPQPILDGFKGTVWSMRVFGFDVTDPLAGAEPIAASRAIHLPLVWSVSVPILMTVILGRVFCSWVCPAGLLFELCDKLRRLLRFAEIQPGEVKFSYRNKYVFLVVGLVIAFVLGVPFFSRIYPPAVTGRLIHALVFPPAPIAGSIVILLVIVFFEVAVSPRWWCRTMCPGGALYGVLGWKRVVRVRLEASRCTGCRDCEPVCPLGLYPVRDSAGIECDNCGRCLPSCPDDALLYSVGLPGRKARHHVKKTTENARHGSSSIAAILLFLVGLGAVLVPVRPAYAHHILGLPHYSYKDNYPQVPTLEYPATSGPYEILMTCYPGIPIPGEAANIAFYIKDKVADQPYDGPPVSVRVLQTATFGQNQEIVPATEISAFDNLYKLSAVFDTDGEYIVELSVQVEGRTEVIPFRMIAGDPSATPSILAAIGGGMIVFLVAVRAVKIKRERHRLHSVAHGDAHLEPSV
ncbi:MAG: 4Fe-4S binding protein [Planctomycetes bacterium]|nr:4Fe-4S binding protein [Planctomycetota bacterium]NOG54529.1 4Fe-4S binding protein [Planctomycetota bacterium]